MRNTARFLLLPILMAVMALLGACAQFQVAPLPAPESAPAGGGASASPARALDSDAEGETLADAWTPTPAVTPGASQSGGAAALGADLTGEPIEAAFNGVPIVAFINEVFGNQLGLSFVISPGLQTKQDLVTLRLADPVPPARFFATVRQVLEEYGVAMRERDGVLVFSAPQEISAGEVPLLISGRTLPEVPATHRTIFQLAPLHVTRTGTVARMLRDAFPNKELKFTEYVEANSVLLRGSPERVAQALEMIEVLDQPLLRGRHGFIMQPSFMRASDLAEAAEKVLEAEGHRVGRDGSGDPAAV